MNLSQASVFIIMVDHQSSSAIILYVAQSILKAFSKSIDSHSQAISVWINAAEIVHSSSPSNDTFHPMLLQNFINISPLSVISIS
jgi:hypothetical protein